MSRDRYVNEFYLTPAEVPSSPEKKDVAATMRQARDVVEAVGVLRAGGEDDAVARVEGTKLVTTTEDLASHRGRKKWPEARWSGEIGASVVCFLLRTKKRTRRIRWCAKGWGNE